MSIRCRVIATMLSGAGLACLAGCSQGGGPLGGGTESQFAGRPLAGASADQVAGAVEQVFSQRFRIASRQPGGAIEAMPQYLAGGSRDTGRLHIISTVSDLRRLASGRVRSEGGLARAEVRVLIQRRDTQQHEAYRAMTSRGDVPTETPIDTGDFSTPQRREVWTTVRRDYGLEGELLDQIAARLGAPPARQSAAPQPR